MTYTVRIIAFEPDEEGNLPAWPLGDPPKPFATAEQANDAGNREVARMGADGPRGTFAILDAQGSPVDHHGRSISA